MSQATTAPAPEGASKVRYVTDEAGNRTAVILSIAEYQELLEDIADLATIAERREEEPIPHEEVLAELKRDGYL